MGRDTSTRPGCSEPHQPGLECFQGWGLHYLSGQPVQCFTTLMVKKFFLISNLNLCSLSLKPLFLVLSTTTVPAENIFPIFPIGLFQVLKGCYKASLEPSLLQAEQPQLSQPFLTGEMSSPLIIFVALLWTRSNSSIVVHCLPNTSSRKSKWYIERFLADPPGPNESLETWT